MPNGDDQVQVQMPDGRILTGRKSSLPTALKMGAKLYDPSQSKIPTEPTGAVAALKQLGTGAYQFGKAMVDPRVPVLGKTSYQSGKGVSVDPNSMLGAVTSGLPEEGQKAKEALAAGNPLAAAGHGIASVIPGVGPMASNAVSKFEKGDVGGGLVMGGAALLGAKGMAEGLSPEEKSVLRETQKPAEIAEKSTTQAKSVLSSIFNEGATREKMQLLQDSDALATKAKISKIDKAVEADAGNLMQKTSQAIDQKIPEGSIDPKTITQTIKKGLGDKVKAKSLQNLPPSLQKIMNEATGGTGKSTATRLTSSEMQTLNILVKEGATGEGLRGGLVDMGYAPKQIDAMMQIAEGGAAKSNLWKFERAKQLRTELGKDLFANPPDKYPGQIRSVMFDTWKQLTDQLDSAAEKAGLKDDWTRGKQKYADYMKDFYGTYERGKYNQSPLDMVLKGQNSKEIMEPLSGEDAQLARDILKKYGSYGVDPKEILSDVRRYGTNKKIMQFASPSKYDIIIGGMALYRPEYGIPMFIARYGLPRVMERIAARRATGLEAARPSTASIPETAP